MKKKKKIICTIGPSVSSEESIEALIHAGMNVARLNFSHRTHEEHEAVIFRLKKVRSRLGVPLAIMLDTKGPEIRLKEIEGGEAYFEKGDKLVLSKTAAPGKVQITPPNIVDQLKESVRILLDDGKIEGIVVEKLNDDAIVELQNSGLIRSGKGVNIPNISLNLPAVTPRDVEDIKFGCLLDIDLIAASFIRSADDILTIKRILADEKRSDILVIAKIENMEGVDNFDSIVQVADGIMIARGDLGVEVPISHVPRLQKMMIRKCYLAGKPSVTATQMLESMVSNPRPTRAEASDVANAIYDSTSAVMLSAETAIGKYPIETVKVMKSIIEEAEADFKYKEFFQNFSSVSYHDVPSSVALASVKTAYSSEAQAIFAFTSSGSTARLISRLRPAIPIIAMTSVKKAYHQLALNWGVIPLLSEPVDSINQAFNKISEYALKEKYVHYGDLVVITAGAPFGVSGTTNMMLVESIGDVLVRGYKGLGRRVHGRVLFVHTPESKKPYEAQGRLLVLSRCSDVYLPLIRESDGFILQNLIEDTESEKLAFKYAEELKKPLIVRADGAQNTLKEGQLATLDPDKALVYKGVVL